MVRQKSCVLDLIRLNLKDIDLMYFKFKVDLSLTFHRTNLNQVDHKFDVGHYL